MIVDGLLPMGHDALFTLSWRMTRDFFSHELPTLSLMALRLDFLAQRPMCRLADLFNSFKNLLALPIVNRHSEGLPAVRGLDDRNLQIAADVCLRFWFLRRFQDLEKLLGAGGRLALALVAALFLVLSVGSRGAALSKMRNHFPE